MKIRLACQCRRAAALLASVLALANSPSAATHVAQRDHTAQHGGSSSATHLYEAQGGSVVAYPLNADGLPAKTPDWRLNGALLEAWAVAFDGAGYLYVSDAAVNQVRVYAPGASGDDLPVRIIPLPGPGCALGVNKTGYVFATYLTDGACNPTVMVYAPVTGPHIGASVQQPVHTISITAWRYLFDLKVDGAGRLFVADLGGEIYGYYDPINEWQSPSITIGTQGREYVLAAPIAIEDETNDIYFQTAYNNQGRWQGGDHARRSLASSRVESDQISLSTRCNGDGQFGLEYSMAVDQNYLMFTCWSVPGLFVYHNRAGRQHLVEALPGGVGLLLWP